MERPNDLRSVPGDRAALARRQSGPYNLGVDLSNLEIALKKLPTLGTLVKDRGYRQIWRFEHEGRPYYLKFYPHCAGRCRRLRRWLGHSPALREFRNLQALQKAAIPAPHALAAMMGFRLGDAKGDAVLLDGIEPSISLDAYLNQHELDAKPIPARRQLTEKIIALVQAMGKAGLGHADLHMGNFLLKDGKVFVLDGYAVRHGGLRRAHIFKLGHSIARYATTTDILRGWRRLVGAGRPPRRNPISSGIWHTFLRQAGADNRYFGRLRLVDDRPGKVRQRWSGVCFKQYKYPYRWAPSSGLKISAEDWQRAWPRLLEQIQGSTLTTLKRSRSGDVLLGEAELGGRKVALILKRARRRYWYRYFNEIGRGSRARRAWFKSWNMIVRNIPTTWPLLFMERRTLGYVTDAVFVCEFLPGKVLGSAELNDLGPPQRDMLFRRTGRILRRIERMGFSHFDAKASNWIVLDDKQRGPGPVLIDVDGVRHRTWVALGIERLLRSMREHEQYSEADSLSLCRGYAPHAPLEQEEPS